MNIKKNSFFITELLLGIVLVLLLAFMLFGDNIRDTKRVYIVVPDSDNNDKNAFKYGLKTAAEEYNIDLVVVSTGNFTDISEEEDIIYREIINNVDGMIIEPVYGENQEEVVKGIHNNIPIVLVNSGVGKSDEKINIDVVAPDNYEMGRQLGEEIIKDCKNSLNQRRIFIFIGESLNEKNKNRIDGIRAAFKNEYDMYVVEGDASDASLIQEIKENDILIGLDDKWLLRCADYKKSSEVENILVYGIGNSSEAVYHVDNGFVECLIVPDDYSVGYQSIKQLSDYFTSLVKDYTGERTKVSYSIVRQKNLFDEENQVLLFTLSQ